MTRTIGSFRSDIRAITRDVAATGITPHHTDAELDGFVVDAFRRLHSVRPESRYDANGHIDDVAFPTDGTLGDFSVTFDDRWYLGLVYFAAARAFETDVTDSVNRELAAGYFKQADAVFAF